MEQLGLGKVENSAEPARKDKPEDHGINDIEEVGVGSDKHPDDTSGSSQPVAEIEPFAEPPDEVSDGTSFVPHFANENDSQTPEDVAERDELWSNIGAAPGPLVGNGATKCGAEIGHSGTITQPADIAFVCRADIEFFQLILKNIF